MDERNARVRSRSRGFRVTPRRAPMNREPPRGIGAPTISQYQHGVTKAQEGVVHFPGFPVSGKDFSPAGEGRYAHELGGPGRNTARSYGALWESSTL